MTTQPVNQELTLSPRLLLIDDDPASLMVMNKVLKDFYRIYFATSGFQGIELVQKTPPELILLDMVMPGMDGIAVLNYLKSKVATRDLPVLFVTACNDTATETLALTSGADDFIHKPINQEVLKARVAHHLEKHRLRREIQRHRDQLEVQVKERTLSLSIAKEAAEAADRLKSAILSNINQEFRTPMTGILGMVGLARRRITDEKVQNYLISVEQSARQLLTTLTGLVDLAAAESNRLTLEPLPFRLFELINPLQAKYELIAKAKGLDIQFNLIDDDRRLVGDFLRIGQIFNQLVDNAIKFTSVGSINIKCQLKCYPDKSYWLHGEVIDQGTGIAQQDLRQIFDPFYQIDSSRTRQYEGSGIGLTLSKRLTEIMGGELTVNSILGVGSTFSLSIPVTLDDSLIVPNKDIPSSLRERHTEAAILVIEDDPFYGMLITELLRDAGLEIFNVKSSDDAVQEAEQRSFDLILVDLEMPDDSAIKIAEAIRNSPQQTGTPILALASSVDDEGICQQAGITAIIPKLAVLEHMLEIILKWLDFGHRSPG